MEARLTHTMDVETSDVENSVGTQLAAPLLSLPPTPFHTPAYLIAYRRCFGAGKKFHRLHVVKDAENAAAFLQTRGRTAKRLEWWGEGIHDIGGALYDSPEAARVLWEKIENLAAHCDGARLGQIPANCQLVGFARNANWEIRDAEKCPVLELPPSWDEHLKKLGKNMREQIKRYPKRLEKEFKVEYSRAQTSEEVRVALDDLFRLHGARWRARGQTGVLATPRRQKFHRAVCNAFLEKDWLRLWTLRCDGKAVCVLLNYFYRSRYYFFIGGFAPEYSRWSVGTCLFSKVFQHAIEEGATEFDFLKGEEDYKYRYGAQNRDYKTIAFFKDSPRGKYLRRRVGWEEKLMQKLHEKFSAAHRN
jgi:CelD/BcsL family acetyltransferase involved in cellulose biosynthesis